MANRKFIAVLNEEVYEITEGTYNKIMKTYSSKPIYFGYTDEEQKKRCELIRKWGRKIMDIDVHLRDDSWK